MDAILKFLVDAQAWVAANIPFIGEYIAQGFKFLIDLF